MLSVLEELMEGITYSNLLELVSWCPHRNTLQRLGYFCNQKIIQCYFPVTIIIRITETIFPICTILACFIKSRF